MSKDTINKIAVFNDWVGNKKKSDPKVALFIRVYCM